MVFGLFIGFLRYCIRFGACYGIGGHMWCEFSFGLSGKNGVVCGWSSICPYIKNGLGMRFLLPHTTSKSTSQEEIENSYFRQNRSLYKHKFLWSNGVSS